MQDLVDPPPRLQDHREERALTQLGIRSCRSPAWTASSRGRDPLRSEIRVSVCLAVDADPLTRLCFDQLLHHIRTAHYHLVMTRDLVSQRVRPAVSPDAVVVVPGIMGSSLESESGVVWGLHRLGWYVKAWTHRQSALDS
jgi:hypothetical protein